MRSRNDTMATAYEGSTRPGVDASMLATFVCVIRLGRRRGMMTKVDRNDTWLTKLLASHPELSRIGSCLLQKGPS